MLARFTARDHRVRFLEDVESQDDIFTIMIRGRSVVSSRDFLGIYQVLGGKKMMPEGPSA